MKWLLIGAALLTLLFGLPFREYNTEQLLPIQTVQVLHDRDGVTIVSEAGSGKGDNWESAVADLRKNASGDVFFDTAEQLLLCADGKDLLPQLLQSGLLRPAAQVYRTGELYQAEGLSAYLAAHSSGVTIRDLRAALAREEEIKIPGTTPPMAPWEEESP